MNAIVAGIALLIGVIAFEIYNSERKISLVEKSSGNVKLAMAEIFVWGLVRVMFVFIIYFLFMIKTPYNSTETLLLDYLSQNYSTNITEQQIENVFRQNDDEVKVIDLKSVNLEGGNSKKLDVTVRKGSVLYTDYKYEFLLKPSYAETLFYGYPS